MVLADFENVIYSFQINLFLRRWEQTFLSFHYFPNGCLFHLYAVNLLGLAEEITRFKPESDLKSNLKPSSASVSSSWHKTKIFHPVFFLFLFQESNLKLYPFFENYLGDLKSLSKQFSWNKGLWRKWQKNPSNLSKVKKL